VDIFKVLLHFLYSISTSEMNKVRSLPNSPLLEGWKIENRHMWCVKGLIPTVRVKNKKPTLFACFSSSFSTVPLMAVWLSFAEAIIQMAELLTAFDVLQAFTYLFYTI
jgi:hypothetical protein